MLNKYLQIFYLKYKLKYFKKPNKKKSIPQKINF